MCSKCQDNLSYFSIKNIFCFTKSWHWTSTLSDIVQYRSGKDMVANYFWKSNTNTHGLLTLLSESRRQFHGNSQTPAITITNNHNVNCDNYCASSVFCNLSSPNLHGTLLRKEYYTHDPFQIAWVQIACLCLLTIDPTKHFENVNYRGHLKLLQTHECLENFISDIPQSHNKMVVR